MKLNNIALGIAFAVIWGGIILIVGIANMAFPDYGEAFLSLVSSIYPGFMLTGSIGQVLIGTIYGLVDGFIGGVIFSCIYNLSTKCLVKSS